MNRKLKTARREHGYNPWFLILFSVLLGALTLTAQITLSTIRGTATDPTGAVVPNAVIAVSSLDTSAKREVTTDENGNFEVPDLPRGRYRLTATATGFNTFVAENILLEGSQIRRINPAFELGTVGTQVSVTAGAAVIETDSAKSLHHYLAIDPAGGRCLGHAGRRPAIFTGPDGPGRPHQRCRRQSAQ
jgi:hypothetical protein